jgi:hypothetical protein
MSDQSQPTQSSDDLTSSDAQAFLAANNLQPEDRKPAGADYPEGTVDDKITRAVEDVIAVRAANNQPHRWIFYAVIGVLVVVLFVLEFININHPYSTTDHFGGNLSVPTPDSSTTQGLGNSAQQQINTCSQVTNTALGKC